MRNSIPIARVLALCITLLFLATRAHAQSSDAAADLAARINQERIARGLVPFALNAQLTAAAQAHANDVAQTANYSHIGSDGSTATERIARAGYGKYSWGYRVGENWARYRDTATAMAMWMESTPHRNNILHAYYREIGIGIAREPAGPFIYVVDFGAQPNGLPVFINAGATETRSPAVTLTLSDERVVPNGDGANVIGHPTETQISNSADFAGAKWQPYAERISWVLTPGAGSKTVYAKYRDARGRIATASASIVLNVPTTPTPRPTTTPTRTPRPSATVSPTPAETPMPTETPIATPTLEPSETLPASSPATPIAAAVAATAPQFNPLALCGFGIVVMLGVLAGVNYLASR